MDKFIDTTDIPKLNQTDINNLTGSIKAMKMKSPHGEKSQLRHIHYQILPNL